ncbi:hypothetical protein V5O48_006779 [Marasmius crinis-equi]|uniref:Uncharacterized protein n=1 Tax=Marasmius crinis-equi TaxID=585013 RepID=A0ABR3FJ01_9AGAR
MPNKLIKLSLHSHHVAFPSSSSDGNSIAEDTSSISSKHSVMKGIKKGLERVRSFSKPRDRKPSTKNLARAMQSVAHVAIPPVASFNSEKKPRMVSLPIPILTVDGHEELVPEDVLQGNSKTDSDSEHSAIPHDSSISSQSSSNSEFAPELRSKIKARPPLPFDDEVPDPFLMDVDGQRPSTSECEAQGSSTAPEESIPPTVIVVDSEPIVEKEVTASVPEMTVPDTRSEAHEPEAQSEVDTPPQSQPTPVDDLELPNPFLTEGRSSCASDGESRGSLDSHISAVPTIVVTDSEPISKPTPEPTAESVAEAEIIPQVTEVTPQDVSEDAIELTPEDIILEQDTSPQVSETTTQITHEEANEETEPEAEVVDPPQLCATTTQVYGEVHSSLEDTEQDTLLSIPDEVEENPRISETRPTEKALTTEESASASSSTIRLTPLPNVDKDVPPLPTHCEFEAEVHDFYLPGIVPEFYLQGLVLPVFLPMPNVRRPLSYYLKWCLSKVSRYIPRYLTDRWMEASTKARSNARAGRRHDWF